MLGTGDLSELALGWSTYGVGDQMSHYNVNASVPKTLIRFLLRWAIAADLFGADANAGARRDPRHRDLAGADPARRRPRRRGTRTRTPRRPSVPTSCRTSSSTTCCGSATGRRKVAFLAHHAWGDRERGEWPDLIPVDRRNQYSEAEIRHWLEEFLHRFFKTSQFKRSALPNAPKVGSGGSLSPRSDWRAPSDSEATAWLDELGRG